MGAFTAPECEEPVHSEKQQHTLTTTLDMHTPSHQDFSLSALKADNTTEHSRITARGSGLMGPLA